MSVVAPDWLTSRGAELKSSRDGRSWTVYFGGQAQYLLEPLPSKGKYSCRVVQIVNGRRLDQGGVHDSRESALQGGLDDLKATLGW